MMKVAITEYLCLGVLLLIANSSTTLQCNNDCRPRIASVLIQRNNIKDPIFKIYWYQYKEDCIFHTIANINCTNTLCERNVTHVAENNSKAMEKYQYEVSLIHCLKNRSDSNLTVNISWKCWQETRCYFSDTIVIKSPSDTEMVPINKGSVVADLSSMSCNSTTSMTLCLDMQDFKECDSVYNWQSDTSFMEIFSFSGLKIILNQKNTTLNGGLISAYCVENNNCDDNTIRSLEINKQLIIMEGSECHQGSQSLLLLMLLILLPILV